MPKSENSSHSADASKEYETLLLTRRLFLHKLFILSGGVAFFGKFIDIIVENTRVYRGLSEKEYTRLIQSAAEYDTREVGLYTNDSDLEDMTHVLFNWKEHLGSVQYMGLFSVLQESEPSDFETMRKKLTSIHTHGSTPVISLGLNSQKITGHPFDRQNETSVNEWLEKWVSFLATLSFEVDVRFLFEMNLFYGDIAYKRDGRISDELQVQRFKELFALFSQKLAERGALHIAPVFSPSAHGVNFVPYVPKQAKKIGFDLYDMYEHRLFGLYGLIFGTWGPDRLFDRSFSQLRTARNIIGEDVPMYLYEFGSFTGDIAWLQKIVLKFLAQGGAGVLAFLWDKKDSPRQEETNWGEFSDSIKDMLAALFAAIDKARSFRTDI